MALFERVLLNFCGSLQKVEVASRSVEGNLIWNWTAMLHYNRNAAPNSVFVDGSLSLMHSPQMKNKVTQTKGTANTTQAKRRMCKADFGSPPTPSQIPKRPRRQVNNCISNDGKNTDE